MCDMCQLNECILRGWIEVGLRETVLQKKWKTKHFTGTTEGKTESYYCQTKSPMIFIGFFLLLLFLVFVCLFVLFCYVLFLNIVVNFSICCLIYLELMRLSLQGKMDFHVLLFSLPQELHLRKYSDIFSWLDVYCNLTQVYICQYSPLKSCCQRRTGMFQCYIEEWC